MLARLFRRKPKSVTVKVAAPKFSFFERLSGRAAKSIATSDMKYLDKLSSCVSFYNAPISNASDPLYQSADKILTHLESRNVVDFREVLFNNVNVVSYSLRL